MPTYLLSNDVVRQGNLRGYRLICEMCGVDLGFGGEIENGPPVLANLSDRDATELLGGLRDTGDTLENLARHVCQVK
jgi:hypothetical protein